MHPLTLVRVGSGCQCQVRILPSFLSMDRLRPLVAPQVLLRAAAQLIVALPAWVHSCCSVRPHFLSLFVWSVIVFFSHTKLASSNNLRSELAPAEQVVQRIVAPLGHATSLRPRSFAYSASYQCQYSPSSHRSGTPRHSVHVPSPIRPEAACSINRRLVALIE